MAGFQERDPGYNWRDPNRPDAMSGAAETAGGMINRDPLRMIIEALVMNPEIAQRLASTPQKQQEAQVLPQVQQQLQNKITQDNLTQQERDILNTLGRF